MINRRSFLLRAAGTVVVASAAATSAIVLQRPKPAEAISIEGEVTATFIRKAYTVTCQEISNSNVSAVWLGEKKVWSETLREVTWSTEDIDLVPDLGDILQIERTGCVDPKRKIGTLGGDDIRVEKFKVKVVSVTEIK